MERTGSVSMQDVAKEAGVSPQTVSRVANGSDAVRPQTRRKVQEAMERLGYRPNYAARALKHGRFNDVGVVLSHMTAYGNSRILAGIVDAAAENGYATTIHTLDTVSEPTLASVVDRMKQLPVDGIIIVMESPLPDFDTFVPPQDLPIVLISEDPANHCPTIDSDQYGCSTTVVDYLLSKGHRTVFHIAGPSSTRAAQSRMQGWRDSLEQLGLKVPPTYFGDWTADSGYQAGLRLGSRARLHRGLRGERPDGLRCDAGTTCGRQEGARGCERGRRGRFPGGYGASAEPHNHANRLLENRQDSILDDRAAVQRQAGAGRCQTRHSRRTHRAGFRAGS